MGYRLLYCDFSPILFLQAAEQSKTKAIVDCQWFLSFKIATYRTPCLVIELRAKFILFLPQLAACDVFSICAGNRSFSPLLLILPSYVSYDGNHFCITGFLSPIYLNKWHKQTGK